MKVLLAHPGTQHSYKLAEELFRKKILSEFWTGFCLSNESNLAIILKKKFPAIYKKIQARIVNIPSKYVKSLIISELYFYLISRFLTNSELNLDKRNYFFQYLISSKVMKKSDVVIGFDTSSFELIKKCKKHNVKFILDVSIAHPLEKEKIFSQLANLHPDWANAIKFKNQELILKEQKEFENSNCLVVASSFTKQSLINNKIESNKIFLNPYGVNCEKFSPIISKRKTSNAIQFLFVGTVGFRKGIPNLINAWVKLDLKNAFLTIVGPISDEVKSTKMVKNLELTGALSSNDVAKYMQNSNVFIFPSYFEGFGLVLLEALACGLPIISTTNTAAPDLITDGIEGFIINPGDELALIQKILFFINNPHIITQMSINARKKAQQFTWQEYGNRWEEIIKKVSKC